MALDLRALIFDLDGVIADTVTLHFRSWQRLADEEGIIFTPEDGERLLGLTREQSLDIFRQGRALDAAQVEDWLERKNRYFHELARRLTPADVAPGVADLLAEARAAGLKLGVGSSSRNVRLVLERLGLLLAFDVLGDGHTVSRPKPAPDIFLWVAERLGVAPAQAVVFEDSPVGVQAALSGGFWVVGLGGARTQAAHISRSSLAGLTLARLIEALDACQARLT